jgi:FkbM family methyltransferase
MQTTVVLDVGANAGQYAHEIRDMGYPGRIVSFEPLGAAFKTLQEHARGDHNHECMQIALGGSDGVTQINVSENLFSSSLLEVNGASVLACPASARVGVEEVQLRRLDSLKTEITHPGDRIHLKLDTQGTEKDVLLGAPQLLEQVASIEMELSLVPLYKGQILMPQMYEMMGDLGFECVWLERGFTDPSSDNILQMDGLFLRACGRQ